jgi:two-component system invasion response regulator UvrY
MTEALIAVNDGKKYICKEIKNNLAEGMTKEDEQERNLNSLSLREMQVMEMVRQGLSSKEIAAAASIAVKTVEVHRYNILRKLKLKNAAALVNYMNGCDFALGRKPGMINQLMPAGE